MMSKKKDKWIKIGDGVYQKLRYSYKPKKKLKKKKRKQKNRKKKLLIPPESNNKQARLS